MFHELGKLILILGIALVVLGIFLSILPKIPLLGKLPGDIFIQKGNFTIYAPIATAILISVLLSVVLWIITNVRR